MGLVYANIEIVNADDLALVRAHSIGEEEVKRMTVNALVDSGAYMMCINETIQEQLNLPYLEPRKMQMADGSIVEMPVVTSVRLNFKNRTSLCNALVLPGDSEVLLGAIPMEEMDVLIHPLRQELIVNPAHPYYAQLKLKGVRKA